MVEEFASIRALATIITKLAAFRKAVDDRFDQQTELINSSFRALSQEIQKLKNS